MLSIMSVNGISGKTCENEDKETNEVKLVVNAVLLQIGPNSREKKRVKIEPLSSSLTLIAYCFT